MVRTHIRGEALLRGMTLTEVAKKLGLYLSNLSAMDSGTRPVSLRQLSKIAQFLHCGVGDLILGSEEERPLFHEKALDRAVDKIEALSEDGTDKSWVPKVTLAWNRHYVKAKKKR